MKLSVITVRGKKALGTVLADPDGLGLFSGGSADSVGMQEHIDADNAGDSKKPTAIISSKRKREEPERWETVLYSLLPGVVHH